MNKVFQNKLTVSSVLISSLLLYVILPNITLKLFFLLICIYSILYLAKHDTVYKLLGPIAVLFISLELLITPISFFFITSKTSSPVLLAILVNILFTGIAAVWIYFLTRNSSGLRIDKYLPDIKLSVLLAALTSIYFTRGLNADLPYMGDESYHVISAVLHINIISLLFESHVFCFCLVIMLALFLISLFSNIRSKNRILFTVSTVFILLSGSLIILIYASATGQISLNNQSWIERIIRYPICQTWLTSFIACLPYDSFTVSDFAALPIAYYRFIMVILIYLLSLALMPGNASPGKNATCYFLAIMTIFSIPCITYYTSVLYLDSGVVVLLTIALFDIKKIICHPPLNLSKCVGWWMLVFSGFMKESALPALLIIYGFRLIFQIYDCLNKRKGFIRWFLNESASAFILFLPIISYLILRIGYNTRPFEYHVFEIIKSSTWIESVNSLPAQIGGIIIFSLVGVVIFVKRGKWMELLCTLSLIVGMKIFFLTDNPSFAGYARFNLYLLPGIIYLAWHAIGSMINKRKKIFLLLTLAVLLFNFYSSPFNLSGEHKRFSDEYFYPYIKCFQDIKNIPANKKILFSNINNFPYCRSIAFPLSGWETMPESAQYIPDCQEDSANLKSAISYAEKNNYDFIIFQVISTIPPKSAEFGSFKLFRNYIYGDYMLMLWISKKATSDRLFREFYSTE